MVTLTSEVDPVIKRFCRLDFVAVVAISADVACLYRIVVADVAIAIATALLLYFKILADVYSFYLTFTQWLLRSNFDIVIICCLQRNS